jgi:multicomponent Na+:H+ antiporter subunit E
VGRYLLLALLPAILWLGLTSQVTVESFVVGYLIGLGLVALRLPDEVRIVWRRLPDQLLATFTFVAALYRDILLSGIDLARRLLSRDMRLKPGILAVPTQDPHNSQGVAALSAANVTLTPGELVVDFDGNATLYVHCLDVEDSAESCDLKQAQRSRTLQRVFGRSM